MREQHTLDTLAAIVDERHLHAYALHWATLWTQVPFVDFNDDETGDIYCIDPPIGGKLQGLIDAWEPPDDDPGAPNPWLSLTPRPKPKEF
jgi:hypothetical protein